MLDSAKIKRELLESMTFSMDEAALIAGLSSSNIKNMCAGRNSRIKIQGIDMQDFVPQEINLYREKKIDFVRDHRGSYPNYRIFFHGIEEIIKNHQGTLKTKENFLDFVKKEKEKIELRKKLLLEMEKKYSELTKLKPTNI